MGTRRLIGWPLLTRILWATAPARSTGDDLSDLVFWPPSIADRAVVSADHQDGIVLGPQAASAVSSASGTAAARNHAGRAIPPN